MKNPYIGKSLAKLEEELWKLMSQYHRKEAADFSGYVECYTCRGMFDWKYEIDLGHYIKRGIKSTKFLLKNLKPQCKRCNKYLDGNQDEFAARLIEDYGEGIIKELHYLKHHGKPLNRQELIEQIEKYKELNDDR